MVSYVKSKRKISLLQKFGRNARGASLELRRSDGALPGVAPPPHTHGIIGPGLPFQLEIETKYHAHLPTNK